MKKIGPPRAARATSDRLVFRRFVTVIMPVMMMVPRSANAQRTNPRAGAPPSPPPAQVAPSAAGAPPQDAPPRGRESTGQGG